jgi:hypothetical protein
MYVWEKDDKWSEEHNQGIVEDIFEDECIGRGYFHRVIFAGISTKYKDSNHENIYTGDVVEIEIDDNNRIQLALGAYEDGYKFVLDDYSLSLSKCNNKKLTRVGTVFYKLDWKEYPVLTVQERVADFNNIEDSNENHYRKVMMSGYTPNFAQEDWKYTVLERLEIKYHFNK